MEVLLPSEVAHYSPMPDPLAQFRGMSWLTPVLREVEADKGATSHKWNFFKRGATPQVVVTYDKDVSPEEFQKFIDKFRSQHEGADNAYRTLHLAGGADVTVIGQSLQQLDFKATQGAGETRIAMAAGVHPVILGASEGMQGSSLNAGNFGQARRRFADLTIRPLWRIAAASLEPLLPPQGRGVVLWYDDRDIPFLREDALEEARIMKERMLTLEAGLRSGFIPQSVVDAIVDNDLRKLEHSGLLSVQLQPPGVSSDEENE